jgi:hypothetical protein
MDDWPLSEYWLTQLLQNNLNLKEIVSDKKITLYR